MSPAAIHRRRLQRQADQLMVGYAISMVIVIALLVGTLAL